ncbi:MAG: helix-turn-helix domain-containing protein [Clostridia bacterium]|nr:helix-turn-helix domain-containing protein [Clostridia bacterium]
MREELQHVLNDVKKKTSLDVSVFDFLGEPVANTGDASLPCRNIRTEEFNDGIYQDEKNKLTYFLINVRAYAQPFRGVIAGVGDMVSNYAYMVSAIIENSFRNFNPDLSKSDALVSILSGKVSVAEVKLMKERYSIPDGTYYVFAISVSEENVGEVLNFLTSFSTSDNDECVIMKSDVLCYLKHVDFQEEGIGISDFAVMLCENIRDELSLDVKVCSGRVVKGAEGFRDSYEEALTGLRLAKIFSYPGKVYSYKEFLIVDLLEELPKNIIDRYKGKLLDESTVAILRDSDMTGTAEAFMNHSLNLSETARSLYIHRNTLMYRLDKIERDTGLNIRVFSDAVTFRILEIIYRMGTNNEEK